VTFQIGAATDLFHNPSAKPLARTHAVLSRSPLTVQGWRRRSPAAFSMSARASAPWRSTRQSSLRRCRWSAVGIDICELSLGLARANVAASPHAAQIELRAQDVTQLDELAAYTLAWLPAPFLPRPVAEVALDRLAVAMAPNGHLVVGLYAVPTDKVGAALTALRVAHSGGHVWDIAEMEQQLRARDFVDVETCQIPPTTFVIARRP